MNITAAIASPELPNVTPQAARKEAVSLIIIFSVLYMLITGLYAGGHWCIHHTLFFIVCIGWGIIVVSILLGIAITAVLLFSLWDWWSDLKSCQRRGLEQNQITSGVPFMPGATKSH